MLHHKGVFYLQNDIKYIWIVITDISKYHFIQLNLAESLA